MEVGRNHRMFEDEAKVSATEEPSRPGGDRQGGESRLGLLTFLLSMAGCLLRGMEGGTSHPVQGYEQDFCTDGQNGGMDSRWGVGPSRSGTHPLPIRTERGSATDTGEVETGADACLPRDEIPLP